MSVKVKQNKQLPQKANQQISMSGIRSLLRRHERDPARLLHDYERGHERVMYHPYDEWRGQFVQEELPEEYRDFLKELKKNQPVSTILDYDDDVIVGNHRVSTHCIPEIEVGREIASGEINAVYEAGFDGDDERYVLRLDDISKKVDKVDWINANIVQRWFSTHGLALGPIIVKTCHQRSTGQTFGFLVFPRKMATVEEYFETYDGEGFTKWDLIHKMIEIAETMIDIGFIHDDLHSGNAMLDVYPDREETMDSIVLIDMDEACSLDHYIDIHHDDMMAAGMNPTNKKHLVMWIIREILREAPYNIIVGRSTYRIIMRSQDD